MPAKVITSGILLVIMASMLVFTVEFFLPLSVKSDMNVLCRSVLLRMENEGGISEDIKSELKLNLENRGLKNVVVDGTSDVRQGGEINLHVEVDYIYSRLGTVLTRSAYTQHMVYIKTAMSRRVIN